MIDRSIRFITQGIAVFLIGMLGLFIAPDAQAQEIGSASVTFADNDNNGWADPGDNLSFQVLVDGVYTYASADSNLITRIDLTRYFGGETLANKNNSSGTNGNATGDNVEFTSGPNAISPGTDTGLDALNGIPSNADSALITVYLIVEDTNLGTEDTLDTVQLEVSDATNGVDNYAPQLGDVVSDTVTYINNEASVSWANIGDDIQWAVTIDQNVDPTVAFARLNNTGVFNGEVDNDDFTDIEVNGNNLSRGMSLSGSVFSVNATLLEGTLFDTTGFATFSNYLLYDEAGNSSGLGSFPDFDGDIDNETTDLGTETAVDVAFSITDQTTDGESSAAIVGTKTQFAYDYDPDDGTDESVESVVFDLSQFGGSATTATTYDETDNQFQAELTLAESSGIDGDLSDYDFNVTVTDSAGNVVEGASNITSGPQEIDLEGPGTLEIAMTINEFGNPNSLLNPSESLDITISGLADDTYGVYVNNPALRNTYTASASNLVTGDFNTDGNVATINGASTGTGSATLTSGSYNSSSNPAGLDIEADASAGTITFYVRDDAGNETSVTATIPFPVDNIVPEMMATQSYTLSDDADGNGVANIGDELSFSFSDGSQSDVETIYLRVQSTDFGSLGQEDFDNYNYFGNDLGNVDGGIGRPDHFQLMEDGGSFSTSFTLFDDQSTEFTGTNSSAGLTYFVVDDAGNSAQFTTDALDEDIDNVAPDTDPSALNQLTGPGTVGVGATLTAQYSAAADAETVVMDLSAYGGSASQSLTDNGGGNFSFTFATTEQEDTPDVQIPNQDEGPAGVRVPVTATDENGNTSSGFARLDFNVVDLQLPTPVASDDITYTHVDNDNGDSRDNNGTINSGEYVRITVDVSDNPDFDNPTGGSIQLGLEAFGQGTPTINAASGAPAPGNTGNGYDSDNQRFIYAFNVGTNAPDAAAGAASIQVRNVTDNGGNETNPNDQQAQYVSASVDEAIDAIPPQIVGTPSMTFSTNTDENGDGIAAVGDEVTISAQVTGADSVVLDARYLGAGFVDMTNTSGDTWEVDVEVQEATDMLYASDNDLGNTTLTVTAFDTGGNSSSQNTSGLPVDNVSVKSPELFTEQQSDGRIQLTINNGPNTIIRGNNTVNFGTDMFGGSVAGTSDWVIYSDQGSGTIDYNTPVATIDYANGATYTSPEYADGEVVRYAVRPVDDAGNAGEVSLTATNSADAVVTTAMWTEPEDSVVFAANTNRNITIDVDDDITSVQFRVRPADTDPETNGLQPGNWANLAFDGGVQGGQLQVSVDGNNIAGASSEQSIGSEYQIIPVLTDNNGNTQTDSEALAANGYITVFADIFDPEVQIVAIDDSTWDGVNDGEIVGAMASGETSFTYQIEDQFDIDPQVGTVQVLINGTTVSNTTISQHIFAGRLAVDGNLFTITLDMTPYNGSNPNIQIVVNDGRDNSTTTSSQQFEVVDNVAPLYTLVSPSNGSKFNTSISFSANFNYTVNDQFNASSVEYELSPTEDFSGDVYLLGTGTSIFGTTSLTIPSEVRTLLTSGQEYYVRAVAEDGNFNEYTTNTQKVIFDTDLPEVTLDFVDAVVVDGQETINGSASRIEVTSDADDIASISIVTRQPFQSATNNDVTQGPNYAPGNFEFDFNTQSNYNNYQGSVLLFVTVTDDAGNTYSGQTFSVYVDNESPTFEIVSINGDETMQSLAPMQAGSDTVSVEIKPTLENEVTYAEAMLNVQSNNGAQTLNVRGEMVGDNYVFRFPLPDYADNQQINMNGGTLSFDVRDTLGNSQTSALNQSGGNFGNLTVVGNEQADIFFTDLVDGLRLQGFVSGIDYEHFGIINQVRLDVMEVNQSDFQFASSTGTPGTNLSLNTNNYPDGEIQVRLAAVTDNEEEFYSDTLTVMIDNTFNPATERATIVDYAGARLGGGNITLTANGLENTGAVEFRVRQTDDNSGYTAIGNTAVKNPDGSFSISITPQEIADAVAGGNIGNLDGSHELIAVAQDDAGYEYQRILGNTPSWNTSGNEDIEDDVATTTVEFDFTAPNGFFTLDGSPLTNDQTLTWNNQSTSSFNALTEATEMAVTVNSGTEDFSHARVQVTRLANQGVGSSVSYNNASTQLLEQFNDAENISVTLDPADFVQDGVYRIQVQFSDDLSNRTSSTSYEFVVGEPLAWVHGYNAEHSTLYLQASPHAQSAIVEISTDGGSSYDIEREVGLTGVISGNNLDGYRLGTVNLEGNDIPEGTMSIRVTASEQTTGNLAQSRFASSPTVLDLDVNYANDASGLTGAQDILTAWTPSNEENNNLGLIMNKQKGDITDLRLEVFPESDQDQVSLSTVTDGNLYSNRNGLNFVLNPAYRTGTNGNVLEYIDGVHFGTGSSFNPGIGSGGQYVAFATNVLPDGTVEMVHQSVRVERVAANRGGTVTSSDGGFSLEIPEFIQTNVGVYVEEDPSSFRSNSAQQLDWMQISSAYWLNASSSALEGGYPATVSISYSDDDIMDSNRDGNIDAQDELELSVVTVAGGSFNGNVQIMNKVIDTGNNTVTFEISSLPTTATRYTLIQKGVAQANPGSMVVSTMQYGAANSGGYIPSTGANASFYSVVSDQISSVNAGSGQLFINDAPVLLTTGAGVNPNSVQFVATTGIQELNLSEGSHNSTFVVDNNNGNRVLEQQEIIVDNSPIGIDAVTTHVGPNSEMTFAVYDAAVGDTSGSGLNINSFYVDVYANIVAEDSSGAKEERVRYLQRVSPEQIDYVGSVDSLMATFNVNVDEEEGEVASLSFYMVDANSAGLQNLNGSPNPNGATNDHVNFGPSSYTNANGVLDRAGNRSTVQQYRAKYDNTAPEAEVMSSVVETGIRIRLTDEGSGVDSTSINITSISSEGESSTYGIDSDEVSYNENSGILTFAVAEFGSTVEIEVADNTGNVAVAEAVSESLQLSVTDFHIFPNPFDPTVREATVEFILSKEAQVSIEGLDFNGRKVIELANDETFAPGVQQMSFAGNAIDGQQLANGVYFLRIVVKNGDDQEEQVFKAVVAKR